MTNNLISLVPRFNSENFDYWSTLMKLGLESQDLWIVIEGVPEEEDQLTEPQRNILKNKKQKDRKAPFQIYQALEISVYERISKATREDQITYGEASKEKKWVHAMNEEISSIEKSGSDASSVDVIVCKLHAKFVIKDLETLTLFCGVEVHPTSNGLLLSQQKGRSSCSGIAHGIPRLVWKLKLDFSQGSERGATTTCSQIHRQNK
ncbi:hypothetical protein ZIOFF_009456 [Zingiber officinale]|uniref:DUF4219 domain-containing protein n=1 Tax=Zingiber officinale TaxID=94328 RepID=A0A8J5LWJ8_ZINOF|nr:hypothetical protein ZIOFF_009456 [Zingiber officinale]